MPGMHWDTLVNLFSRLNDPTADPRMATVWLRDPLSQEQLEAMYRGSDMAAIVVDAPIDEMFRRGFDLVLGDEEGDSHEVSEAVMARLEELEFIERLREGLKWSRAYGGAGLFLGADDGQEATQALDEKRIETFDSMTPLVPLELRPVAWESDITSARYGEPLLYMVQPLIYPAQVSGPGVPPIQEAIPSSMEPKHFHHSRMLRLDGVRVNRRQIRNQDNVGWGDSVLIRLHRLIADYEIAWGSAAHILKNFSQPILKTPGLWDMTDGDESTKVLNQRIAALQASRSALNMMLLDKDEDFETQTTSVAGLSDVLQQFAIRLAAAARMPVTVLMGQSPAGLNATGDADVRNWYARVAAMQERILRPAINRVLKLLFLSKDGPTDGIEPKDWRVVFRPLWQETDLERATLRYQVAQADKLYIDSQVLAPEEVALSRFGGTEYNPETLIDKKSRTVPDEVNPSSEPEPQPMVVMPNGKGAQPTGQQKKPGQPVQ